MRMLWKSCYGCFGDGYCALSMRADMWLFADRVTHTGRGGFWCNRGHKGSVLPIQPSIIGNRLGHVCREPEPRRSDCCEEGKQGKYLCHPQAMVVTRKTLKGGRLRSWRAVCVSYFYYWPSSSGYTSERSSGIFWHSAYDLCWRAGLAAWNIKSIRIYSVHGT